MSGSTSTESDTLRQRKTVNGNSVSTVSNMPSDEGRKKDAQLDVHTEYVFLFVLSFIIFHQRIN